MSSKVVRDKQRTRLIFSNLNKAVGGLQVRMGCAQ